MTHQYREGASALVRPPLMSARAGLALPAAAPAANHLDGNALAHAIAARQRALADTEQRMVAACEAAAARGAAPEVNIADRGTWDRATWNRYLAAATRLEPEYGPTLRQLHSDIAKFNRLMKLSLAGRTAA